MTEVIETLICGERNYGNILCASKYSYDHRPFSEHVLTLDLA